MSRATGTEESQTGRWSIIGPGLVVAATGVGAADLVATLVAGSRYAYGLFWCVVVGCILKVVLVEGVGRYTLAARRSIFEGWSSLGRWTQAYFVPYIVIWGFVYGAAAMAGTGLPLHSLFPVLPVSAWGIISGILGLALVWMGRYGMFEKICAFFVGLMFVSMVGAAVLTVPNLVEIFTGLRPWVPGDGIVYVLALAGGVGGTITLAAYGYWINEKGWTTPTFMRAMRIDNAVAYIVTGLFVAATLIVGAELLYSAQIAVSTGDKGLLDLSNVLEDRYGDWAGTIFLVGFWAAAMSSLIGVWNGVSLMFADTIGTMRKLPKEAPQRQAGGLYYRFYILWLTFPPMVMLFLGQPVWLILAYGVLGSLFMPFLAVTLLWLLNTDRVPREWRNGWLTNVLLVLCTVIFAALAISELTRAITNAFG